MSESTRCPKCGIQLPADAPAGLCPKCLVQAGFESEPLPQPHPVLTESSPASAGFEPPSVKELAGKFQQLEILEFLGKGGMGAVYKARQRGLDRLVAVKVLPPEIGHDAAFAMRFSREARALARLSHSHIVSVYDFGQADGLFFIVMEYVDGVDLRQSIQSGGLSPADALAIVPQICEALQFAHDEGIVHRDIKPENILIDKKGRVKIADFGLAKLLGHDAADHSLTGTHQVMGTVRYMAPEQMEGTKAVDHRADIYSLGVVFYEMLTGELPLGRFAPPSHKVQIDVRLDEVVLRSLEKEPGRRYQQASEVKTDVEAITQSGTGFQPGVLGATGSSPVAAGAEATFWFVIAAALILAVLVLTAFAMSVTGSAWCLLTLCLPWFGAGMADELSSREQTRRLVYIAMALCLLGTFALIAYGLWLTQSAWPLLAILTVIAAGPGGALGGVMEEQGPSVSSKPQEPDGEAADPQAPAGAMPAHPEPTPFADLGRAIPPEESKGLLDLIDPRIRPAIDTITTEFLPFVIAAMLFLFAHQLLRNVMGIAVTVMGGEGLELTWLTFFSMGLQAAFVVGCLWYFRVDDPVSMPFWCGSAVLFCAAWLATYELLKWEVYGLVVSTAVMSLAVVAVVRWCMNYLPIVQDAWKQPDLELPLASRAWGLIVFSLGFLWLAPALYKPGDSLEDYIPPSRAADTSFVTDFKGTEHRLIRLLRTFENQPPTVALIADSGNVTASDPTEPGLWWIWLGAGSWLMVSGLRRMISPAPLRPSWTHTWRPALIVLLAALAGLVTARSFPLNLHRKADGRVSFTIYAMQVSVSAELPERELRCDANLDQVTEAIVNWSKTKGYSHTRQNWMLATVPDDKQVAAVRLLKLRRSESLVHLLHRTWGGPPRPTPTVQLDVRCVSSHDPAETVVTVRLGKMMSGWPPPQHEKLLAGFESAVMSAEQSSAADGHPKKISEKLR